MGFASTPPTVLVKKEAERLTGQHSEGSQTNTNLSSPTTRTVLPPSEDEKRLFPDFEVGSDAEVIITPSNIRLKENMRSSLHSGAFKPVNTLSGANPLDYGHHNIPKTYGKSQRKRLRPEIPGGDDMGASDEPWDLHSAEVLASKKPKLEKAVVISDDEGEIEMLSASPKTRTSGRPKNTASPRVSSRSRLPRPSSCETHPVSGRIPEYQWIEKQMTVPGVDAHHSGKINSRLARYVTSISKASENPRASRAFLTQNSHSDGATDTVIAKDQLKQPNHSASKGIDMAGNMFRSSNGKRNGVNEESLSKQTPEEILDDDEPVPVEAWKFYTGTAFQSKPMLKATNQTLPSRSMKPTRRTLQTGTSSRHFAGNALTETQQVENPSETRRARHANTGPVFERLDSDTPHNARDTFKRVEDLDNSPDILLSNVNVRDVVQSKSRIRDRMTTNQGSKSHPSSPPEIVPDPQLSLPSSPADIRGTQFTEGKQGNKRQSLIGTRNSKRTEDAHFQIRMLNSGVTPQLGELDGTSAYNLIFDATENTLVPCACDSRKGRLCGCNMASIPIRKTLRIFHSDDDGRLVELQLSRDRVPIDTAFIQLYQASDLLRFVQTVQGVSNCATVDRRLSHVMLKRYATHRKNKEEWESRLHDRPSERGLDQHAQFLQDKKLDQRKSRRLDGLSDTELSSKRQRVEPDEGSFLAKRDMTRRLREPNDYIRDSNHDNPHETRSRSRLDRKPRPEEWQDPEEIRSNTSAAQESKFLILKQMGKEWQKPLVYPSDGPRRTTVDFDDLERLDEGEFLNDNIIAFYLRYLERQLELSDPDNAKRIYFFNTFFYERLTKVNTGKQGINYEGVQKWTSKIDIFDFDYIVVPVNESAHWYVTIICNLPNLARTLGGEEPPAPADGSIKDVIADDGSDGGPVLATERSSPRPPPQPKEIGTDRTFHEAPTEDQMDLNSLDQSDTAVRTPNMDATHKVEGVSNEAINADGGEDAEWPDDEENRLDHPSSKPGIKTTCVVELSSVAPKTDNASAREDSSQIKVKSQNKPKKAKRRVSLRKYEVNDPIIITLDSLGLPHNITARNLKEYLMEEGKTKRRLNISIENIAGMNSKEIPLQDNYCDCGVFLLGYIERFLQNPKSFVNKILRREMDQVDDWSELNPSKKRDQLRELILELHDQQDNASKGGARSKGKHHKNKKLVSEKDPEDVVANRKEHYRERSDVSPPFQVPAGTEASTFTDDVAKPENDPGKEESLIVLSSNPVAENNVSRLEEEKHIIEVVANSNRSEEVLHESSQTPIEVSALEIPETQESDFPSVEEIMAQEMERPHERQKRRIESRQKEVPSRTQPPNRSERKQRTLISLDD